MLVKIMQGLPGSGKSTWAENEANSCTSAGMEVKIVSADFYHMIGGRYQFDPTKKAAAHNDCLKAYMRVIGIEDADLLIVDNTNTQAWEIAPYYRLAEMYGEDVEIVRLHCDFETACKRNVHGVPAATIWAMYQALLTEKLPPWWRLRIVLPDSKK